MKIKILYKVIAMAFIKMKYVVIFSIIMLFVIVGVIVSCAGSKNKASNKIAARVELDLLMFHIEKNVINVDALTDQEYIDLGHKFAALITTRGAPSLREHYFRINFSRAPKTLDEMVRIIMDKESNIFEWELLPWQNMAFHMYGKDGEYNLKFISADGHFEAVYNKEGILLTQDTDPLNMGTFNYAHQLADQMTHYNVDVWPYFMWNNTAEAMQINKTEKVEPVPIDKNEDAMERYTKYKELLNRG
ncbi:MAG: hypothetical protein LBB61_06955 [Treponema sp.]|jgi:hypothetical protein|nr:hypothetical protein [Treponema sp.]